MDCKTIVRALFRRPSRGSVDRNLHSADIRRRIDMSPLAWGRGSKQQQGAVAAAPYGVAPRVGGGSKQRIDVTDARCGKSPLAWGRGSKHMLPSMATNHGRSPLAWGRGSKRRTCRGCAGHAPSPLAWGRGSKRHPDDGVASAWCVAPRVGAWIETGSKSPTLDRSQTSPLAWGRGSKLLSGRRRRYGSCRPSRGGVDRN